MVVVVEPVEPIERALRALFNVVMWLSDAGV